MEFRILGPLEVYDASGTEIRLPGGREKALLVALLLHRGEVVSIDALIDALWGEHPPSTAPKAIQGYVSHIRRALAGENGALVTQSPGYAMRIADSQLDAARFERLAADGQRTLEDGDAEGALVVLDSALRLWRGPALAEFAFDDFAQHEIQRLTERRLEAVEDRAQALLELGRHGGLVSELETLVSEHPLRERLRAQLMLALCRSGRTADALQAYKDGARRYRELGLDPPGELRSLERSILDQDPSIAAPARAPIERPEAPVALPRPPQRRAGRDLVALLAAVALALTVAGLVLAGRDGPSTVAVVPPAVAVVDPASSRVVRSIPVGSRPVTIAASGDAVWVGDARDGTVTRIDAAEYATRQVGIGAAAVDLATTADSVWVATGGSGQVVRIDAALGLVADGFDLADPSNPIVPAVSSIAAGGEGVWIGTLGGVARIDTATGEVVRVVDLGGNPALQLAAGGGAVWGTTVASRALRVEAASAQVTKEFYAGAFVFALVLGREEAWVGGDGGKLWKIDPVTGATRLTANVGSWPEGLALGEGALWATLPAEGALARLDPETGEELDRIPLGGLPGEVVVHAGLVWVTVGKPDPES